MRIKLSPLMTVAAAALVLIAVVSLIPGGDDTGGYTPAPTGGAPDAIRMCQQFAAARLVAPATAKFPPAAVWTAKLFPSGDWQVSGYVDSQNRLGALVRSDLYCEMRKTGDQWRLDSISVAGR
jgi:hypothetical protein